METKFLLYGDLHLKSTDSLGNPTPDGLNTRFHRKLKSFEAVGRLAIEQKVNFLVDLGDLWDSINPVDRMRTLYAKKISAIKKGNMVEGGLVNYTSESIRFIRIGGNHETDGINAVGQDVSILSGIYKVITEPTTMHDMGMRYPSILFIPEIAEEEIVKLLVDKKYKDHLILGHFGVEGAVTNSGMGLPGIPQLLLKGRKCPSYLGHVHKRQILANGMVQYIGALCRDDFGDKDIQTGCTLLTIQSDENGVIEGVTQEFIEVQDTRFEHIVIAEGVPAKEIDESITGSIVKLEYKGTKDWFTGLTDSAPKKMKRLLIAAGAEKVIVKFQLITRQIANDLGSLNVDNIDYIEVIKEDAILHGGIFKDGEGYFNRAKEKLNA